MADVTIWTTNEDRARFRYLVGLSVWRAEAISPRAWLLIQIIQTVAGTFSNDGVVELFRQRPCV